MSGENSLPVKKALPHPWYVYLATGHTGTFLCPWFLFCHRLFDKGNRKTAVGVFVLNLLLFAGCALVSWYSHQPWYVLCVLVFAGNLSWSMAPWVGQRLYIGKAPGRYRFSEWKTWIEPICVALVIGTGLSVVHAIFLIAGERITVLTRGAELLATRVFLWDLFVLTPKYLCYSAVVGLWWAGYGKRFSIAHVLTYLAGLLFLGTCTCLLSLLFVFLLFHGEQFKPVYGWRLLPVLGHKWTLGLHALQSADMTPFVIIPLFIGVASRFRDFWLRAFMVFPLVSLLLYGVCFFSPDLWKTYQEQILHELSDADPDRRAQAFVKLKRMLDRFGDHENRHGLMLQLADFYDQQGLSEKADAVYSQVKSETRDNSLARACAKAALDRPEPGGQAPVIPMPLISYTDYMTNNWMVLLRTVHYFTQDDLGEDDLLSSLKGISTDKDEIELSVMPSLAELDDNARFLGQTCLILPTDRHRMQALLAGGYPVILDYKKSFLLIRGMAPKRDFFVAASYKHIPALLRRNTGEEITRGFALFGKKNESKEQSIRVDHLSRYLMPAAFWGSPAQKDMAPFMAVVFPPGKAGHLAGILGQDMQQLKKQSNALLSALIALNSLNSCDPVQTIAWARKSHELVPSGLAMQVAHLSRLLWESRLAVTLSGLPLDRNLPALQKFNQTMDSELDSPFMQQAAQQFDADSKDHRLPWMIRAQYRDFLDRSIPEQRKIFLTLVQQDVAMDPDDAASWVLLANLYEWQKDQEGMSKALQAALDVRKPYKNPGDKRSVAGTDRIKIDLMSLYVEMGLMEKAEKVMAVIDPERAFTNADYYYCKAAVSNWKGKERQAATLFKKAISMRKYTPNFHLAYARFLVRTGGSQKEAKKALEWAIRIDTKGDVRPEAQALLTTIQGQKT